MPPTNQDDETPNEIEMPVERLSLEGTVEEVPVQRINAEGAVEELTGLQRAGISLLTRVGLAGVVIIIMIFLVSFWDFWSEPRVLKPLANYTEEEVNQYKRASDIYKEIRKTKEERAEKLFQVFIVTGLLPVFTTILGYIFGSAAHSKSDSKSEE